MTDESAALLEQIDHHFLYILENMINTDYAERPNINTHSFCVPNVSLPNSYSICEVSSWLFWKACVPPAALLGCGFQNSC
jgi:hypothetical protein